MSTIINCYQNMHAYLKHSTTYLLLYFTKSIYQNINNNSIMTATFFDISHVYYSLWKKCLKYKLFHNLLLKGKLLFIIFAFSDDLQLRIINNNIYICVTSKECIH